MLLLSHITNIDLYAKDGDEIKFSEEWRTARLGKFTASNIFKLMGAKGLGDMGQTYIRTRCMEELAGVSTEKDIMTEEIVDGIKREPEAINRFLQEYHPKVEAVVVQKLVCAPDSKFSCTPDIIIPTSVTEQGYNVITNEVKCYGLDHHGEMLLCESPEDVKKADPKAFWQLATQMDLCGALDGNAIFFNPLMRSPKLQLHIVPFRKIKMMEDFKLLKARMAEAEKKFVEIRDKLLSR